MKMIAKIALTALVLGLIIFVITFMSTPAFAELTPESIMTTALTPAAVMTSIPTVAAPKPKPTMKPTPKPTATPKAITTQYGKSGEGRTLYVTSIKVVKPTKKLLVTFELHGFEDAYARDGQKLVNIGKAVIKYFTSHIKDLKHTSLYVVCSANPDGLAEGYTNNGPGRCQISLGVDINRDFGYLWFARYESRYKTLKAFSTPESRALRDLVIKIRPTDVIDIHGWLTTTYGSRELCKPFENILGIYKYPYSEGFRGRFYAWSSIYAKRTCLIELPSPNTSANSVISALKVICKN